MSDGILKELSADWIAPLILLGLRERDSYGYELAQRMVDLGFETTRSSTMRRILRQMESEGMVVSEYEGSDGWLSRRRYSITEPGEAYLEFWADSLARHQEEIDLFFRTYSKRDGQGTPGEGDPKPDGFRGSATR